MAAERPIWARLLPYIRPEVLDEGPGSGKMRLYRLLGIPSNADKPAIQKAYRLRSWETHPDRGGDAKRFQEIRTAYRTLMNDAARELYDKTGEVKPDMPDQRTAGAIGQLSKTFVLVMQALLKAGMKASREDIVKHMRKCLEEQKQNLQKNEAELLKVKEFVSDCQERFEPDPDQVKGEEKEAEQDSVNLIEAMLAQRLTEIEGALAPIQKELGYIADAQAFLKKKRFVYVMQMKPHMTANEWAAIMSGATCTIQGTNAGGS